MSNPVADPPSGPEQPRLGSSDPATGHAYLPPAPEERPSLRSKLLKALAVVVAVVVVLVFRAVVFGDEARSAEVGDCVEASAQGATDAEAKVVDCGSAEAAYVVVAKVPGVSSTEGTACDQYFKEGEQFAVYGSRSSTGEFVLCLRPAA